MPVTGAPAIRQDQTIQAGAAFIFTFTTKDQDGDPIDLTGAAVRGEIRSRDGRLLGTLITAVGIPSTNGVIRLSMTATATKAMEDNFREFFPAFYDVIAEFDPASIDRVLEGSVSLSASVSV